MQPLTALGVITVGLLVFYGSKELYERSDPDCSHDNLVKYRRAITVGGATNAFGVVAGVFGFSVPFLSGEALLMMALGSATYGITVVAYAVHDEYCREQLSQGDAVYID